MRDPIERQAEIDAVLDAIYYDEYWKEQVERAISALPSAQPERKTGEWIPVEDRETPYGLLMECSKCKNRIIINDALEHNYCSECGADMRSEESDEQ